MEDPPLCPGISHLQLNSGWHTCGVIHQGIAMGIEWLSMKCVEECSQWSWWLYKVVTWMNIPQAFLLMPPLNFLLKSETCTTVCLRKGSFKASRASIFVIIQACYPHGDLKGKTEKSVSFHSKFSLPSHELLKNLNPSQESGTIHCS